MENENLEQVITQTEPKSTLHQVTPLSKYLALALFVILPFIGGWIGYTYAPIKVEEVEKIVYKEIETAETQPDSIPSDSKSFPVNDIFWDLEIYLSDSRLYWKHDYQDKWSVQEIISPETLQYVGFGVFKDDLKIYSLGYLSGTEDLSPNEQIEIVSEKGQDLIVNGNKVFALVSEMSLPVLAEIEGIDAKEFEVIGGGYVKDAASVFFMGANTWRLEFANPDVFETYLPDSENDKFILGVSGDNVYYKYKLLEGISYSEMTVENFNSIIRDADTVWFSSGNCHFGDFTKGELDKIDTYQPPC